MATILHADMDAFYASVEQRDDPSLRGRPVAVGFGGKRGVVAAASYEARRFGVRSAMPSVTARKLCPELVFVRSRMKTYAETAARVRDVFYRYTPLVEAVSLDEAYLDVGASVRLFGSVQAIAIAIRHDIRTELDLPCSVGVGSGKLVAKIASNRAKPDGLLVVEPDATLAFLRPLRVSEIWGVGRVTEERLLRLGIATIAQLADANPAVLEEALGSWGQILHGLANGEDLRTVEGDRARKSYSEESTFEDDVTTSELIGASILAHAETIARRLRRDGRKGRTITLKFRPSTREDRFRLVTRARTLDEATDDGPSIAAVAEALWEEEPRRPALRLVGVQVSGLDGEKPSQLALFHSSEDDRRTDALNAALDDIVKRFGPDSIRRGGRS